MLKDIKEMLKDMKGPYLILLWLVLVLVFVWFCSPSQPTAPRAQVSFKVDPRQQAWPLPETDRLKLVDIAEQTILNASSMDYVEPAAFAVCYDSTTQRAIVLLNFNALTPNEHNTALKYWSNLDESCVFAWLRDRFKPEQPKKDGRSRGDQ